MRRIPASWMGLMGGYGDRLLYSPAHVPENTIVVFVFLCFVLLLSSTTTKTSTSHVPQYNGFHPCTHPLDISNFFLDFHTEHVASSTSCRLGIVFCPISFCPTLYSMGKQIIAKTALRCYRAHIPLITRRTPWISALNMPESRSSSECSISSASNTTDHGFGLTAFSPGLLFDVESYPRAHPLGNSMNSLDLRSETRVRISPAKERNEGLFSSPRHMNFSLEPFGR